MTDKDKLIGYPWRVGRSIGRTIYADAGGAEEEVDKAALLVGLVDTPALATHLVEAHNQWLARS